MTATCPIVSSSSSSAPSTADLLIEKSGPTSIVQGQSVTYTIRVANAGPGNATNVVVNDPIPAGLTYQTSNGANCSVVGGAVRCTLGTIASNDNRTFTVTFGTPAPGANCSVQTISNTAGATSDLADSNGASATASMTATCPPPQTVELLIEKSGPTSIVQGQDITYTVRAGNAGPATATNVIVTDTIPTGLTYVRSNGATCSSNGTQVRCTLGTIAANGNTTFTLTFTTPQPSNSCTIQTISNTASIASDQVDSNPSTDRSTAVITALCPPPQTVELLIQKSGPSTIPQGQNLVYTIRVANAGPATATNVIVTDPIPSGLTYLASIGATCSPVGTQVRCLLGTISANDNRTFALTFSTSAPGNSCTVQTISNTAAIASDQVDSNSSTDSSTAVITATCPTADLAITKTGVNAAPRNSAIGYTITVTNNGPATATNVSVSDPLPAQTTFNAANSDPSCSIVAGAIVCNLGTILPGQPRSFFITLNINATATCNSQIQNFATVAGAQNDPNTVNNRSQIVPTTVQCPVDQADISIQKSGLATVQRGDQMTYAITVANAGPQAAQNVVISDVLPTLLTNGNVSVAPSSTVNNSSSNVQCGVTSGVLTCTVLNFPANGTLVINLSFTVPLIANCTQTTMTNTAQITSSGTNDPNAANNSSSFATTVTCPAIPLGCIDVIKEAYTDNSLTVPVTPVPAFTFTLDNASQLQNDAAGRTRFNNVPLGTHTVIESALAGWTPNLVSPAGGIVQVNQTNSCSTVTFKNVQVPPPPQTGCIDITKLTFNPQGQPLTPVTQFTYTLDGASPTTNDSAGRARYNFVAVGNHTIAEIIPSGWTQTALTPAGGAVTVTASPNNTACAQVNISNRQNAGPTVDVSITKTATPTTVVRGNNVQYTLTVLNTGTTNATNVVVTDSVPAGFQFVAAGSDASCALQATGNILCTVGILTPATPRTLLVNFTVPTVASCTQTTATNTASVSSTEIDSNPANNQSSATITVNCPPVQTGCIQITKTANDANNNPIASVPAFTFTLDGGTPVSNAANGQARFDNVTVGNHTVAEILPSGWTQTSFTPAGGVVAVAASAGNVSCSQVTASNRQNPITTNVDLSITKTANPTALQGGSNVQYTLNVQNLSSTGATAIVVTDTMPNTFTFISSTDPLCTPQGGSIICNWPSLAAIASRSVTLTFATPSGSNCAQGNVLNTAFVRALQTDSNLANNQSSATVNLSCSNSLGCIQVTKLAYDTNGNQIFSVPSFNFTVDNGQNQSNNSNGQARFDNVTTGRHSVTESFLSGWVQTSVNPSDGSVQVNPGNSCATITFSNRQNFNPTNNFTISKTDGRSTVRPGETLTYTITVRNSSGIAANNVTVTDTVPDEETVRFVSDGGYRSGRFVTWRNLYFGPYETKTLTLIADVNSDADGTLENRAQVAGQIARDFTTIEGGRNVGLDLTKSASTTEVLPGGIIAYTVQLRNTSNDTIRNLRVTDNLPNLVSVIDDGGADSRGTNQLTWNIGSLSGNASRTIRYRVSANTNLQVGQIIRNDVRATADGNIDEHEAVTVFVIGTLPQTGGENLAANVSNLQAINRNTQVQQSSDSNENSTLPLAGWIAIAGLASGAGAGFLRRMIVGI